MFAALFVPLPRELAVTSGVAVPMAVINSPYVGIARGRLGEGVFSRVKGQTTVRGYNPTPANPRSAPQQSQRAQFSSAVKFFSRGVQNFFKFAFENKLEKESDYNAFMRLNANRGMYFGPVQNETPEYPALGRFIMTRGSIPAPDYYYVDSISAFQAFFNLTSIASTPQTLGELSSILVSNGYQQGDVVTFCVIKTDSFSGSASEPVVEYSNVPVWDIRQFTLDVTSSAALSTLGLAAAVNSYVLSVWFSGQDWDDIYINAGCVTISRPSSAGLKVSSSELYLNGAADVAYIYGVSELWKLSVLQAWNASQESIMQGSRSVNKVINARVLVAADPSLPFNMGSSETLSVYFNDIVSAPEVAQHLIVSAELYGELITYFSGGQILFKAKNEETNFWQGVLGDDNVLTISQSGVTGTVVTAVRWAN